jgi:hypothetical protein
MSGLVEQVLKERYGEPLVVSGAMLVEHRWNEEREARRCELYRLAGARPASETTPLLLQSVYGDFIGGSFLQGSMKLAVVAGPTIYGLYSLSRLRAQPEVCDAGNSILPLSSSWTLQMCGTTASRETSCTCTMRPTASCTRAVL